MRDVAQSGIWILSLVWLTACLSPLDAPSAFSDQVYLCGAENAALEDAALAQCRDTDAQCEGVVSFRGTVDAQPVTVGSPITHSGITDVGRADGTTSREIFVFGLAPYFTFSFDLPGFEAPPGHTASGLFVPVEGVCSTMTNQTPCEHPVLNLEARGGTYLSIINGLVRDIQIETADDLQVYFTGELARGGNVEGCFHLLAPHP